jgi:hypothetical protein
MTRNVHDVIVLRARWTAPRISVTITRTPSRAARRLRSDAIPAPLTAVRSFCGVTQEMSVGIKFPHVNPYHEVTRTYEISGMGIT